ncbi:MAG: MFS transporter [Alphaproteobacteria bacterium]|nr:MFS transporter [Alphaproteobacteria bacterium]
MSANIISERIDNSPISFGQYAVIVICFILNMLDGFDIVSMSVVASTVSEAWSIEPEKRGLILSAALVGMTLGATFIAPFCDKFGRRKMMLIGAVVTGLAMLITGFLPQSIILLIIIRIITGLGIGVIMASTTAITTEYTPARWRNLTVPIIVSGYAFGAMMASPIANYIMPMWGWEAVFIFGGSFTLATAFVMFFLLPESINFMANQKDNRDMWLSRVNKMLIRINCAPIDALPPIMENVKVANVASLLQPAYISITLRFWVIFFAGLLSLYFFLTWTPSLLVDNGLTRSQGNYALFLFNLGGVLGIWLIGYLTTRVNLTKTIAICFALGTVSMVYLALSQTNSLETLYIFFFIIGWLFQAGFTAMYTVVSRSYPSIIRATGIGWAIGLGRTGAIVAPIIVGILVDRFDWHIFDLFILFACPLALMALLVAPIKMRDT